MLKHHRFAPHYSCLISLLLVPATGCSSDSSGKGNGGGFLHMNGDQGGSYAAGGATGLLFGQGGQFATETGGAHTTGGAMVAPTATGGAGPDTSVATGGTRATGGAPATGGTRATGGVPATGSTSGGSTTAPTSCASVPTATGYMTIASNGYAQSYYTTAAGFAYTWVGKDSIAASTCISPSCDDTACTPSFGSSAICAAGKLPGDSTYKSVVGFGFNLNQPNTQGAAAGAVAAPSYIKFYYTKSGTAQLRLQLGDGTNSWCFDTVGSDYSNFEIPIDEFNTACWNNSGEYLTAGTPIKNAEIVIPSGTSAVSFADCLLDIGIVN